MSNARFGRCKMFGGGLEKSEFEVEVPYKSGF